MKERGTETDRQRHRDRQTDRQTDRQRDYVRIDLIGLHLQRLLDGRTVLSVLLHITLVLCNIEIL